ncbi:DUF6342 family protein [Streptomyces flaveolus]|jgi:hypothetical protein|uniref:DUF6342 family protein n=1 Tax=Streptomyces flaveolus TaxID=67297 RepID=UPI0033A8DD61
MAELDLGAATQWSEGETHGRVKLAQNQTYSDMPSEKNVVIISPNSVEIQVNSNLNTSQEADKIYFTTFHGNQKKVLGILDSDGNLSIAGKVITDQKNLTLD